ncbi:MAG: VTT domain-containing protein [Desulfosarcinaceae bacterium]|nr:VTT domain-containing protein [Desulfosarcinaceae bacterium]
MAVAGLILLGVAFNDLLLQWLTSAYDALSDRDRVSALIRLFGPAAPLVFMALQIFQVLLAPVPGEMTGFLGGYLFGVVKGFLYSTIALSLGSMLNFGIGRVLGERYVRRWISAEKFARYDRVINQKGLLVIFSLFVFPGFPKDWLCLFLGLSSLPLRVFVFLAAVGRMPGTLMLSLQGHYLFEQNYVILGALMALSLIVVLMAFFYRDRLYEWAGRINPPPAEKR